MPGRDPHPSPAPPAYLYGLIAFCSLALLTPLAWPLLTGRVFAYNDLSQFHLPMRFLYQQALQAGDSVLWTPAVFGGLYMHGEGQIGAFHPFHQLIYRVLPLGPAFNIETIASYPFAFAGAWWLLRRLAFCRAAAGFGAMLFAFSGFALLHHHHVNMIAVLAHLPWLLAAADLRIVDDRPRTRAIASAAIAAIVGSAVLLGFPQAVWWNLLTLSAFALFRAAGTRRWSQLLPCAGAVVLGLLLGAIQLLPTADVARMSVRTELSRDFALTYSLHPINLFQLWSPYFFLNGAHSSRDYMWFHEFGIYSGAILPVALLWVWIRRRAMPERRTLVVALTAFAALMLVLALGRYGGVATLLTYVPGLQMLRAPVRYVVLMDFALAIVAAVAIEDLVAIAAARRPPVSGSTIALWIPTALGVASLTINSRLLPYGERTAASAAAAAPGVAIGAGVTLLVYLAGRRVRWALPVLVVLTAADLAAWGVRFVQSGPIATIAGLTRRIPPPPETPADAYAVAPGRGDYSHNVAVLKGYRLTNGYAGLYPAMRHPLESDHARRLGGARWFIDVDGSRRPVVGGVARARLLDDDGRPDATGTIRLAIDSPGRLLVDLESPARRVLALTERFHDGWSAWVDGARVPTIRVEGDFLGCVVDAGVHRVELRFMPRSFVYGSIISVLAALVLVAMVLVRR